MKIFGKKKGGAPVVLFADPVLGMALARRIAARGLVVCGRREGSEWNGGETRDGRRCPGTAVGLNDGSAGAGCKHQAGGSL
jgi:hypothetical protein